MFSYFSDNSRHCGLEPGKEYSILIKRIKTNDQKTNKQTKKPMTKNPSRLSLYYEEDQVR